ncbi:MAG: hypothetical protein IPG23_13185 [Burkholderiales bacterium]|nr:hypothetical protein [Burkholderiales bacterium]
MYGVIDFNSSTPCPLPNTGALHHRPDGKAITEIPAGTLKVTAGRTAYCRGPDGDSYIKIEEQAQQVPWAPCPSEKQESSPCLSGRQKNPTRRKYGHSTGFGRNIHPRGTYRPRQGRCLLIFIGGTMNGKTTPLLKQALTEPGIVSAALAGFRRFSIR